MYDPFAWTKSDKNSCPNFTYGYVAQADSDFDPMTNPLTHAQNPISGCDNTGYCFKAENFENWIGDSVATVINVKM